MTWPFPPWNGPKPIKDTKPKPQFPDDVEEAPF